MKHKLKIGEEQVNGAWSIVDENTDGVLFYEEFQTKKRAEFICLAVNNFDDLLKSCRNMASILNGLHMNTVISYDAVELINKTEREAREVIKSATKG